MHKFRSLDLADVPVVASIHKSCLHEFWSAESFYEILGDPTCHSVGLLEKAIIGFLVYRTVDRTAEILTFCVKPGYQGQGYGTLILQHFFQSPSHLAFHEVFLEVRESNRTALHIYHKLGFRMIGRRRSYYDAGPAKKEDALLLQIDLKKDKITVA